MGGVWLSDKQFDILSKAIQTAIIHAPIQLKYEDMCGKSNKFTLIRKAHIIVSRIKKNRK